jgi:hypothetical protein
VNTSEALWLLIPTSTETQWFRMLPIARTRLVRTWSCLLLINAELHSDVDVIASRGLTEAELNHLAETSATAEYVFTSANDPAPDPIEEASDILASSIDASLSLPVELNSAPVALHASPLHSASELANANIPPSLAPTSSPSTVAHSHPVLDPAPHGTALTIQAPRPVYATGANNTRFTPTPNDLDDTPRLPMPAGTLQSAGSVRFAHHASPLRTHTPRLPVNSRDVPLDPDVDIRLQWTMPQTPTAPHTLSPFRAPTPRFAALRNMGPPPVRTPLPMRTPTPRFVTPSRFATPSALPFTNALPASMSTSVTPHPGTPAVPNSMGPTNVTPLVVSDIVRSIETQVKFMNADSRESIQSLITLIDDFEKAAGLPPLMVSI